MVFSRIFGKQPDPDKPPKPPAPAREEAEEPVQETEESAASAGDEDVPAEWSEPDDWAARARRLIPDGSSTGSKRVDAIWGGPDGHPTHFRKAVGCRLISTEGETLIDCTMALGSVALGYAEPQVTQAVIDAVLGGTVSGLPSALEVEVAERFCAMVPCSERVQFVKTGAEAMSAAVRIARTATGRDVVIGAGYFGWHDWSSDKAGVPAGTKQTFRSIPFDDIPALDRAASEAGNQLAAVVLEPVVERLPSKEWVQRARKLCDDSGAVLIFDEMKTGFRLATGGYQQFSEITPDLAAFGKAMAYGFPLAAVCGIADVMSAASKTWISSTLASETSGLAAANAVLSWHEQADICATLWSTGAEMRRVVADAITASGIDGVSVEGIDPMWFLKFEQPDVERRFLQYAAVNGVLFKRGAYNFAAIAHDEDVIREIESAASAAFVELQESGE
jgi:glutamate-1-semialdehyde 2,1-aminomutase